MDIDFFLIFIYHLLGGGEGGIFSIMYDQMLIKYCLVG